MPREFEISDVPQSEPGSLPQLSDILKYADIITRVLFTVKSAEALAVGPSRSGYFVHQSLPKSCGCAESTFSLAFRPTFSSASFRSHSGSVYWPFC